MAVLNQVRTIWTGVAGVPYYTTLHHDPAGAVTIQQFVDAWLVLLNAFKTTIDDGLVAVVQPDVRQIESSTGETVAVISVTGGTVAMTTAGDALPPANQALIRLLTNNFVSGRRIRGRIFMPGMVEANNGPNGAPSAGAVSGINSTFATFKTSVGASWVVYSPTHRVFAIVQTATMWSQWAILRSRRD